MELRSDCVAIMHNMTHLVCCARRRPVLIDVASFDRLPRKKNLKKKGGPEQNNEKILILVKLSCMFTIDQYAIPPSSISSYIAAIKRIAIILP